MIVICDVTLQSDDLVSFSFHQLAPQHTQQQGIVTAPLELRQDRTRAGTVRVKAIENGRGQKRGWAFALRTVTNRIQTDYLNTT
jgi:hypothetical protein